MPASVSKQAFTGGMPKTFVLSAEDETWVKSTVGSIREELKRMLPAGTRFEETVLSIITRERHYVSCAVPNTDLNSAFLCRLLALRLACLRITRHTHVEGASYMNVSDCL